MPGCSASLTQQFEERPAAAAVIVNRHKNNSHSIEAQAEPPDGSWLRHLAVLSNACNGGKVTCITTHHAQGH